MATWEIHRYPRSTSGPQGISYYSTYVTPTDYVAVKSEYGEWTWTIYTTRRHTQWGAAVQLAKGDAPTLAKAKAAGLAAWREWAG